MKDFLGTGWSYPPTFSKATGTVNLTSGEEDIERSLEILLSTRLGERILQHDYGSDLTELNFEPLSTTTQTRITSLVKTAILLHEPRIVVNKINLDASRQYEGFVELTLNYTITSTNNRFNFVYPFYLQEGTFVEL
ncbi:MAG: GPW/gp25 family protein [Bacteroidia bacterium]|nr:GPW/gp25 family protein [Bacteroidia bacterium]